MNKQPPLPSERLTISSFFLLMLLAWLVLVPGSIPPLFVNQSPRPFLVLCTVAVSVLIVVTVLPVVFRGSWRERFLAAFVGLLPASLLVLLVLSALPRF
jgi:hypothetical protein